MSTFWKYNWPFENNTTGYKLMKKKKHYSYRAAHKATEAVYGQVPDYTREGGSIPVTLDFANILNLNVLLLPVGRGDDGAHSTNEKIDTDNYIRVCRVYIDL